MDDRLAATVAAVHGAIHSAYTKRQAQSPAITAETEHLSAFAADLTNIRDQLDAIGRRCHAD